MNIAVQSWKMYGGFLRHMEGRNGEHGIMLVDIHAMRGTGRPAKNTRFRFQVMADDVDQSNPIQFRSRDMAYQYFFGMLAYTDLLTLIRTKRARLCF